MPAVDDGLSARILTLSWDFNQTGGGIKHMFETDGFDRALA